MYTRSDARTGAYYEYAATRHGLGGAGWSEGWKKGPVKLLSAPNVFVSRMNIRTFVLVLTTKKKNDRRINALVKKKTTDRLIRKTLAPHKPIWLTYGTRLFRWGRLRNRTETR